MVGWLNGRGFRFLSFANHVTFHQLWSLHYSILKEAERDWTHNFKSVVLSNYICQSYSSTYWCVWVDDFTTTLQKTILILALNPLKRMSQLIWGDRFVSCEEIIYDMYTVWCNTYESVTLSLNTLGHTKLIHLGILKDNHKYILCVCLCSHFLHT